MVFQETGACWVISLHFQARIKMQLWLTSRHMTLAQEVLGSDFGAPQSLTVLNPIVKPTTPSPNMLETLSGVRIIEIQCCSTLFNLMAASCTMNGP